MAYQLSIINHNKKFHSKYSYINLSFSFKSSNFIFPILNVHKSSILNQIILVTLLNIQQVQPNGQLYVITKYQYKKQYPKTEQSQPNVNMYQYRQKIVDQFSIQKLREKWNRAQLKIVENKVGLFQGKVISFDSFTSLFSKIRKFQTETQKHIYQLFAYEGRTQLSKEELINSLTLIRKVNKNSDFANFIFYVYTRDKLHIRMTQEELKRFQHENQPFFNHDELLSKISEFKDQPQKQTATATKQLKGTGLQSTTQGTTTAKTTINLQRFTQIFQGYNLLGYQQLFSWDMVEQQKQLVMKISKEGIQRKKGDVVYLIEYQWFLEWKAYAQWMYKIKIEVSNNDNIESNYASLRKRKSKTQDKRLSVDLKQSLKYQPPGEIKNYILKSGNSDNQLVQNLVELNGYICVHEDIWNGLVSIYHGGPPIKRIYRQIYYNTVIRVYTDQDGKFIPKKMDKIYTHEKSTVGKIMKEKNAKLKCYYKYPGKNNWLFLKNIGTTQSEEIFNCPRTYVVFVHPSVEETFLENYNITERKEQRYLKKRIKNYGSEINVSVNGVLTKAEVVQIVDNQEIMVEFVNQSGISVRISQKIDEKLNYLNPENLSSQSQLNELSGFSNIGNTCYMNAVLQCLIRTPLFGGYLQKQNFTDKKEGQQLLLQQMAKIYLKSKTNNHETINTKQFKKMFDKHCPFFQGNQQHDAQQFLICLLSRISQEIKTKRAQFGLNSSVQIKQEKQQKSVNKRVVKFFSGMTEATTECIKCSNKGIRKQSFFTYSLSLPQSSEVQFPYFFIPQQSKINWTIPIRYSITLHRKTTIQQFLKAVCIKNNCKQQQIALYTVFNNEILNKLQIYSFQKQIMHHLNFNTRLVCYQISFKDTPTFADFKQKKLSDKSIKIELRQRIYSQKTCDYRIIYLPFLLEIKQKMTWNDITLQIKQIISKFTKPSENQTPQHPPFSNISKKGEKMKSIIQLSEHEVNDTRSYMANSPPDKAKKDKKQLLSKFSLDPPIRQSGNVERAYNIRVIKTDHYYENSCVFCRQDFILNRYSKGKTKCKGKDCKFDQKQQLFSCTQFRNIFDNIIITVDWQESIPDYQQFRNDPSYDESILKSQQRHDKLEDLLVSNFTSKENLDLRCEKKDCKCDQATRNQKIIVAPNILLLHLKRFTYEDNMLFKLTNNVVYPALLTLSQQKYELYGVVVHIGSGVGGHYISYVKVFQKWYKCDDSRVTLAKLGQEIDPNAYLLFYKKVDFEPSLICLSF